ncbi:MAG: hypothetical protein ABSH33_21635, partial [Steroidobacteraceae bacterium]
MQRWVRRAAGPWLALAGLLASLLLSPATGSENLPALQGRVTDRSTGAPLAGVMVTTDPNGAAQAISD